MTSVCQTAVNVRAVIRKKRRCSWVCTIIWSMKDFAMPLAHKPGRRVEELVQH